jgi:outer membrane protein OmpA-like peptidoglycan-associated protein
MRSAILGFVLVAVFGFESFSQSSFIPKALDNINTPYDDINPVLSADGKTLYFTIVNHPENKYGIDNSEDIWMSSLGEDEKWLTPVNLKNLNIGRYNSVMAISGDGNVMLINGIYNEKANIWKKRGLSTVIKIGEGWSTPEKLKIKKYSKLNRGRKSSASMSNDGKYIVLSFSKKFEGKRSDLFISDRKNSGKYRRPKKLKNLNTRFSEDAPFLSADGKTLYFSSDRNDKKFNIYKSIRTSDKIQKWQRPVILSDTVNSSTWASYFKTNQKGSLGYFSALNQTSNADIYKLKIFEENPFVVVSGSIQNAKSKRLLKNELIKLLVNGQPYDSAEVDTTSATYKLKLPLGKAYTIAASVDQYTESPASVDVRAIREYTTMHLDLAAQPLPYVLVKGRLKIKGSEKNIPTEAKPVILVNGVKYDSVIVTPKDGTYEMRINHGANYTLQVNAHGYNSTSMNMDLKNVDSFQEITKDLLVDAEKAAHIIGTIIDKKTGKPLIIGKNLKVVAEGSENIIMQIDTLSGRYELKVPLGKTYTISANAPGYYSLSESIDIRAEKEDVTIFRDLTIVPVEVGQSIRLNNIFFEVSKAVLKVESFPELDRVIKFLNENPAIKVEIAGHTDNVGKAATNLKLSLARATSVLKYLNSKGIAKERVVAKGYGVTKPVASNKTKEGKAQNRRVEFTILDK